MNYEVRDSYIFVISNMSVGILLAFISVIPNILEIDVVQEHQKG